ncbi:MAG: hypothetical protein JW821_02380 [Deltaproteobacteria bacterium]|nr:hypothetical protein [Deltaproteobacteria bacterium]
MSTMFEKIQGHTRLLNPFKDFALEEIPFEIRFDPLTGQTGRVFDIPFKAEPPNLEDTVRRSREIFCPFCPEALEKSTPLFPQDLIPEGRISLGRATLIPNLVPFEKYAGVAILSDRHYLPMEELTPANMRDAFLACLQFFHAVAASDGGVRFLTVNWNYMPPAGSSIVHAHLQPNCGEVPTNELRAQMEGCRAYAGRRGSGFWEDFMEAEKRSGERYLAEIGPTFWALSFVPLGFLPDFWCVFREPGSLLDMEEEAADAFLEGLFAALKHFAEQNVFSFNVSVFSVRDDPEFRINARVSPRLLPRPIGNSDFAYLQALHREPFCVRRPEADLEKAQELFRS